MNTPVKYKDGYITNAIDLTVDDVVRQKVLCPFCGYKFKEWPFGWDEHAGSLDRCNLSAENREDRKKEYKERLRHLFR